MGVEVGICVAQDLHVDPSELWIELFARALHGFRKPRHGVEELAALVQRQVGQPLDSRVIGQ
jgi:hypothetical protein